MLQETEEYLIEETKDILDGLVKHENKQKSQPTQFVKVEKAEDTGPYIIFNLRFGRNDLPTPDPREGPVEEQERLIEFWQNAWDRNEHPIYQALSSDQREYSPKPFSPSSLIKLRKDNVLAPDLHYIYSPNTIKKNFANDMNAFEPVRTRMAHFIEDAKFLEWALQEKIAVYGIFYNDSSTLELSDICHKMTNVKSLDFNNWRFKCEVAWVIPIITFTCIFTLNSGGKPTEWIKDNRAVILHGTGNLERKVKGIKNQAGHPDPVQWPNRFPDDNATDTYHENTQFKGFAGREMVTCTIAHLPYNLYGFWLKGQSRVFIKQTDAKRGVWLFDLPAQDAKGPEGNPLTPVDLFNRFLKTYEGEFESIISCFGNNGTVSFMIQSAVIFRYEYRFWVSNGKLIAGTPVRRDDTMLADQLWLEKCGRENAWQTLSGQARTGVKQGRFRPFMCADRSSDGPHLDRKRVSEYVRCARVIAESIGYISKHCVLDLGTDQRTGKIIPIEVNSFNHAGCYGMPAHMICKPILEEARKSVVQPTHFWLGYQD